MLKNCKWNASETLSEQASIVMNDGYNTILVLKIQVRKMKDRSVKIKIWSRQIQVWS